MGLWSASVKFLPNIIGPFTKVIYHPIKSCPVNSHQVGIDRMRINQMENYHVAINQVGIKQLVIVLEHRLEKLKLAVRETGISRHNGTPIDGPH